MNQEPNNKITDQQLDDMLRDIRVPTDLKDRLLKIPHATEHDQPLVNLPESTRSADQQTVTRWLPYVLVATLLITASVIATQWFVSTNANHPDVMAKQEHTTANKSTIKALATYQAKLTSYEAEIQRLELEQSTSELLLTQSSPRSYLDPDDVSSMIMALAPEYSQELGGTQLDIKSEMALVLEEFPQSRGADLAQQILQQLN